MSLKAQGYASLPYLEQSWKTEMPTRQNPLDADVELHHQQIWKSHQTLELRDLLVNNPGTAAPAQSIPYSGDFPHHP
jgi:hypothetical protein